MLDDPDALEKLAQVWGRLWAATRPLPPMLEYRWVRTWWQLHRTEGKLLVILAVDGDAQPVGIAPLYLRRPDHARLLRTIHFLGTGEREADEVAGEYLGWLAAPEHVDAVTETVGHALRDRAAGWDRLRLHNVVAGQNLEVRLPQELAPVAHQTTVVPRPTFRIAVRPLEEYVAGLTSANFRHRCRRALRAGAESGVQLVSPTDADEVKSLYAALARLHQQRWSDRGRPGVFDSAVFRAFHDQHLPAALADGSAWLSGLRQGDRWLAARYHLRAGDRVFDYVSGIDTDTDAALGPGLLLTLHGLKWCAENGVTSYDLLAGDYEYKRKLATEVSELYEIDVFGTSLAAQLWLAARRLRSRWLGPGADPSTQPAR